MSDIIALSECRIDDFFMLSEFGSLLINLSCLKILIMMRDTKPLDWREYFDSFERSLWSSEKITKMKTNPTFEQTKSGVSLGNFWEYSEVLQGFGNFRHFLRIFCICWKILKNFLNLRMSGNFGKFWKFWEKFLFFGTCLPIFFEIQITLKKIKWKTTTTQHLKTKLRIFP